MNAILPVARNLRRDDRGSMPMLMMVIVVSLALGGLLLPTMINQSHSTRFDTTRVRALDAAQAGVDVAIGKIRATAGATDIGNDALLPCAPPDHPITGVLTGVSSATYSVTIKYFLLDPTANPTAVEMRCVPGAGPYDAAANTRTPRFARITSTGNDGISGDGASTGRTIMTDYAVKTDDVNVPGGQLRLYPDASGNQWCMDAGSARPASGTPIVVKPCSTSNPPVAQQVFGYRTDLSIQLVSSVSTTSPNGLCLDTSPLTHAANDQIVLKPCNSLGSAPWNQKWSVDNSAHLQGSNTSASDLDGYCIDVASQTDGQAVRLQTCAGGVTDTRQTWIPSPSAGAGMAGAGNSQLVNFQQFATCLDVTNQRVSGADSGAQFIILYTCKQNPNPARVAWNQKFVPSPTLGTAPRFVELVTTYTDNTKYCLTSPKNLTGYVTVTPCPGTRPGDNSGSAVLWQAYQTKQADGVSDLPYAQKFTMVDGAGFCLTIGPTSDLYNGAYTKARVAVCDGSTAQKWNADPSLSTASQQNTHEEK